MAERRRRGDNAQMMLLTAVLLMAGFLALGATLARLNVLPQETGRERMDPFTAEFATMQETAEAVAIRLDNSTLLWGRDYTDMLDGAFATLVHSEAERGFSARASAVCSGADVRITLELANAFNWANADWILDLPEDSCS